MILWLCKGIRCHWCLYFAVFIGWLWWGAWRAWCSPLHWLCMEAQLYLLHVVAQTLLCDCHYAMRMFHRLRLGMLLQLCGLPAYLVFHTLYQGLWDQHQVFWQNLWCYHPHLLWSLLWSLWKMLRGFQEIII